MKKTITLLAAAGIAALFTMPVSAESTMRQDGVSAQSNAETTEFSSRHRGWRHRHYGYRHRHWGPRYGYYRPYRHYGHYGYYRPYYGPGVSLGFGGGPRFGVWF